MREGVDPSSRLDWDPLSWLWWIRIALRDPEPVQLGRRGLDADRVSYRYLNSTNWAHGSQSYWMNSADWTVNKKIKNKGPKDLVCEMVTNLSHTD